MDSNVELLGLYLQLARAATIRQELHARDKLLVIAGMIAVHLELPAVAAFCRYRVLEHNSRHLIRRWQDLATALDQHDFQTLLKQLQRRYPREKAENMLTTLGIEMGQEWKTYYSAEEYAASLLTTTTETLEKIYLQEQSKPTAD